MKITLEQVGDLPIFDWAISDDPEALLVEVSRPLWDAYTKAVTCVREFAELVNTSQPRLPFNAPHHDGVPDPVGDTSCTYCGGVHATECPHCREALPWDPVKHHCRLAHAAR